MSLFRFRTHAPAVDLQRRSCSSCSTCFTNPIESMPQQVQTCLESIREKLILVRTSYLAGDNSTALTCAREIKRLIIVLSSYGEFRTDVNSMFAAHVPETAIQHFIARAQ